MTEASEKLPPGQLTALQQMFAARDARPTNEQIPIFDQAVTIPGAEDNQSDTSVLNTRNSENLQIPKHRIEHYTKAFTTQLLRTRIIHLLINTFKRQLKLYMNKHDPLEEQLYNK